MRHFLQHKTRLLLCVSTVVLIFGPVPSFAQDAAPESGKAGGGKADKKVTIVPMPVIGVNPTTGFVFGVAPGFYYTLGDPATTSMSSLLGMLLYTTNNQLFTSLRGTTFLEGDKYMILNDIRFNLNSQPTYGLGTNPEFWYYDLVGGDDEVSDNPYKKVPRQEMMYFNNVRFYTTVFKRAGESRFFYGLGYHWDHVYNIDDKKLDLESDPQQITFHYEYQDRIGMSAEQYAQSGVSLNAMFDSRDNVANPYDGQYAFASFRAFPEFLGSTASGSQLWLEYRNYFTLNKQRPRNLLAFWAYGWFVTGGDVPYMFLPAVGWDMMSRSGRPYTQGRFRGEDLIYTELEWRFPLSNPEKDRLGGVLFVNASTASNRNESIGLYEYLQFGYGGGIRYMLNPKKRVNIALDYGFGAHGASGLFLNLTEMF